MNNTDKIDQWIRLRMQDLLPLTVAAEGLIEAEARWMDDRRVHLWCSERLELNEEYRVRVDCGGGESVDIRIVVKVVLAVQSKRRGQGFLHASTWEPTRVQDFPTLMRAVRAANPSWANTAGQPAPASVPSTTPSTTSSTTSYKTTATNSTASASSHLHVDPKRGRSSVAEALRGAVGRGRPLVGQPVQVTVTEGERPRVVARFSNKADPSRYFVLEPEVIGCKLPCIQDLVPGENVRVVLGLPGKRKVRGSGVVRRSGQTWLEIAATLLDDDRRYIERMIEGEDVAAAASPLVARLGAGEPPGLDISFEDWRAVTRAVDYDGLGLRIKLADPGDLWDLRSVSVALMLPDGLFIHYTASALRGDQEIALVSAQLSTSDALLALLKQVRGKPGPRVAVRWE